MKNKKGFIRISDTFLRDIAIHKEQLSLLFSKFFPIRIETDFDEFRYYGYSDLFVEIKEGDPAPEYMSMFTYQQETDDFTLELVPIKPVETLDLTTKYTQISAEVINALKRTSIQTKRTI